MNFKQFFLLQEAYQSRIAKISPEQFKSLYEEHCSQFDPSKQGLYRGISEGGGMLMGDPRNTERRSKNTSSHTMWLLETFPEWEAFPKRTRSFICSTSEFYADYYGSVYHVIPYDNAQIGICPSQDFFESFPKIGCVTRINYAITTILQNFENPGQNHVPAIYTNQEFIYDKEAFLETWNKIKNSNYTISDAIQDINDTRSGTAEYVLRKLSDITQLETSEITNAFNIGLKQALTRFESMPFSEYSKSNFPDKEIWLSHPCLFLRVGVNNNLEEDLENALNK